jgi:hypothetical protein
MASDLRCKYGKNRPGLCCFYSGISAMVGSEICDDWRVSAWLFFLFYPGAQIKQMKTGKNQVVKGKRGMDEFAQFLEDHGARAVRGHNTDCEHSVKGIHFEVKRQEVSKPYLWLEQAISDVGFAYRELIPVVAHRQNRKEWIAILDLGDLMTILKRAGML